MKKPRSSQNILAAKSGRREERPPLPTGTELEILHLLWENGPSTVRQVLRALRDRRGQEVGYTTALKMLQVMTEKRLVGRDETTRPQVYSARLPREETQKLLVTDLLEETERRLRKLHRAAEAYAGSGAAGHGRQLLH